jgi:hypothetical protein
MEWNPRHLETEGHRALLAILEQILLPEFPDIIHSIIVTRMDFAVDVTPMTPDAIFVEAESLTRGDIRTGRGGSIEAVNYAPVETIYLGARGSATFFRIYNRNNARTDRVSLPPMQTRIEAQLRPRIPLRQLYLSRVENPFGRLLIVDAIDASTLHDVPDRFRFFLDSVQRRGLRGALRMLRNAGTRSAYRKWMRDNFSTGWFNPDHIWEDYNAAWATLGLEQFYGPQPWRFRQGRWTLTRVRSPARNRNTRPH